LQIHRFELNILVRCRVIGQSCRPEEAFNFGIFVSVKP